jgi:8-oxo-dGTP diphosphatase
MIQVTAAIIYHNDKILICQRAEGSSCSLLWEFPGGKLEPGEMLEECIVRECKEELDIDIRPLKIYQQMSYQYPEREIYFTFFIAEILGGQIKKNVHKDIKWVEPSELGQYEFCPADVEIVNKLSK